MSEVSVKKCCACGEQKPRNQFFLRRDRKDGLRSRCKDCEKSYSDCRKENNRDAYLQYKRAWYHKNREKFKQRASDYRRRNAAECHVRRLKSKCKKAGIPFNLDQYIPEIRERFAVGICELTGIPISHGHGTFRWDCISIDRIVPAKGYVYSNIRIICYGLNAALNTWGEDILASFIEPWLERRNKTAA